MVLGRVRVGGVLTRCLVVDGERVVGGRRAGEIGAARGHGGLVQVGLEAGLGGLNRIWI